MFNKYGTKITEKIFDEVILPGSPFLTTQVKLYKLERDKITVELINFGATITAIKVPDRDGNLADVVLGYDNLKGYMKTKNHPYLGATIGRVTNRIAKGSFELNGVTYQLSKNAGDNTLHGGIIGFDKKVWEGCVDDEGVVMTTVSDHLEEGFPGRIEVFAKFVLCDDNRLVIKYRAKTDRTTIVNMTNHSYFNLNGHNTGAEAIYKHKIMINAFNFTPTDENLIPKGKIQDVYGTCLDLTQDTVLGDAIKATEDANGFDINYCINNEPGLKFVARVIDPESGRKLEVSSNQPGVQFYTSNCLSVKDGKGDSSYGRHSALCLETQNYPNAINQKNFPSPILNPSDVYEHIICYQFGIAEEEEELMSGKEGSLFSLQKGAELTKAEETREGELETDTEAGEETDKEITEGVQSAKGSQHKSHHSNKSHKTQGSANKSNKSIKSKESSKKSIKSKESSKKKSKGKGGGEASKSTMGSAKSQSKKSSKGSKPSSAQHVEQKQKVEGAQNEESKGEEEQKGGEEQKAPSLGKSDPIQEKMPSVRSISNLMADHPGSGEKSEPTSKHTVGGTGVEAEGLEEEEGALEYIDCPPLKKTYSLLRTDEVKGGLRPPPSRPVTPCLTDWSSVDLRHKFTQKVKAKMCPNPVLLATLTTDISLEIPPIRMETRGTSINSYEFAQILSNSKVK